LPEVNKETQAQIISLVSDFVRRDVLPVVKDLEAKDIYPEDLIDQMAELGLFGITIPQQYGGMGLDHTTFAMIFEELSKGWMSLTGPIGTHHVMASIISNFGTPTQKETWLPKMASGEIRGGLGLTEPSGGSDIQAIQTKAVKNGNYYEITGSKMFITNGDHGHAFAVLAKTNENANPAYRGMSCFIVSKDSPGFSVGKKLDKLGYKGVSTCELIFQDAKVPENELVGQVEGKGFAQVLSALESGRINVAARAVGVAQAAFEDAIKYSQTRETFGKPISSHQAIQLKLADMATKIQAARLLTYEAAKDKDNGKRVDLQSGMAKLFASEMCAYVAMESMRIHGGYGYIKDLPVERYYRDAPLMIIGEGTNEILSLLIAKRLLDEYKL